MPFLGLKNPDLWSDDDIDMNSEARERNSQCGRSAWLGGGSGGRRRRTSRQRKPSVPYRQAPARTVCRML